MSGASPILLLGNSVRYLAQSARSRGFCVHAVDAFADTDTKQACHRLERADSIAPQSLVAALPVLDVDPQVPWSYGAGFETAPRALLELSRRRRNLVGNDPHVLILLADTERFFALLSDLDIAFPPISLQRPGELDGWLFKAAGRLGGLGVHWASSADAEARCGYYQRFAKGPLCSMLFAADGNDMRPIGFNRLLVRYPAAGDFRFAGAIAGFQPNESQRILMLRAASRLTRALALRGVNGIDFVINDGKPQLLELNARPPSTLELYESCLPGGGLWCHLQASRGELIPVSQADVSRGFRILYARNTTTIGDVEWPSWVTDRPLPGSQVRADQPLCAIHASGTRVESVEVMLRERADTIESLVNKASVEAA